MALPMPPPPAGRPQQWSNPAGPVVSPGELRPARWWYWVAGGLVAVGFVAGAVIGARAFVGLLQLSDLDEFTTGEEVDFELSPDEPTSIYVLQTGDTLPVVECSGRSPEGAGRIDLSRTDLATSVLHGGELWVSAYDVDVSEADAYTIECQGFDLLPELRVGLGPRADPFAAIGRSVVSGLLTTLATGAGIVIGVVVGIRRSSHKRRLLAERRPPATRPPMYGRPQPPQSPQPPQLLPPMPSRGPPYGPPPPPPPRPPDFVPPS